jgi:hypothetical protein
MTIQSKPITRSDHVTLMAIYQFVAGGLAICGAIALLLFVILPIIYIVQDRFVFLVSLAMMVCGVLVLGSYAIAAFVVGIGLLRMRPWARMGALVLALLGLPGFPIGTVAGVLIIAYLLSAEGRQAFTVQP